MENLVSFIFEPNVFVLFLLLMFGGLGLLLELLNPGLIFPGLSGVALLVLALLVVQNLSINMVGPLLILLSFPMAFVEIVGLPSPTLSRLRCLGLSPVGAVAVTSFFLGSMFLVLGSVSFWIWFPVTVALTLAGGWLISTGVSSRRPREPMQANTSLVGVTGYVTTDLAPRGSVLIAHGLWSAVSMTGETIISGSSVTVVREEGLFLTVRKS